MDKNCYKLPICFEKLLDEESSGLAMCNELESIDQHIELLLTTCPGEHKFNKNYGCRIWDMDFARVVSRKRWEEEFTGYILEAIQFFEKRLSNVSISIQVMEVVKEDQLMKTTAIKKKVKIYITAVQVSTGKSCGFNYTLYLGPLATE